MKTKELIQWLKDNSSGNYRPSREAAEIMEEMLDALNNLCEAIQNHDSFFGRNSYVGGDSYVDAAIQKAKKLLDAAK